MRTNMLVVVAALAAVAGTPAARAEAPGLAWQRPQARLNVAAAASLKGPVEELRRGFEAEQPGVEVALTLGASGAIFSQLRSGAPFDVFLSADREYPRKLVASGLAAAGDERVYAIGKLVAWLPPGSALDLEGRGLAALTDPAVRRIAVANPAVAPFGRATVAALEAAGVHDAVREKLVLGTSAAQVAQFATTGAADVAFIPSSLTFGPALSKGRSVPVPEALHPRIEQSGVVLDKAREKELARAFLAFVTGGKGRAILARYGYGLP